MKDFAKSIVCDVKAEVAKVGNYNPKDYENDPRHKWTIKSIENEIQKYKQRIELNRVRITQLRNMENSGNYPSSSRELKEEQKDYEANQMKVKQLVSMLRRATGNELPEDMVGNSIIGNAKCKNAEVVKDGDVWVVLYAEGTKSKEFNSEAEAKKFAAQIGNSKVGNAYTEADRKRLYELAGKRNKTAAEWAEFDELNRREEQASKEMLRKLGKTKNSKVGNADKYSGNYIIMSDDGNVWFRDEHEDVSIRNIDSWAQKRISEYQRSIDEIKKGVQEAKQAAKKYGLI